MTNDDNWTSEDFHLIAERAYELHLQGKHAEALTIICGLLALDPENTYALDAAAALSLALGRPADVLHYTSTLLSLSPHHNDAIARRCEAHILLGRFKDVRDDLEHLKRFDSKVLYTRMQIRLAAASRTPVSSSNTESFGQLTPITR